MNPPDIEMRVDLSEPELSIIPNEMPSAAPNDDSNELPEIEGLQPAGEGQLRWHVASWTGLVNSAKASLLSGENLSPKAHSPEFTVAGKQWRLLLFPCGNNSEDLAVYLEYCKGTQTLPPEWSCCAQFSIALCNPFDESLKISQQTYHRFEERESDWGFSHFVSLKALFEENDKTAPLIEKDQTIFVIKVRVVNDETGTLWRSFINYDSKKITGYVGLKNQGATCYMNSLLQSLFFIDRFRIAVYQIPTENDDPTKSVPLALQRVFYHLQFDETPVGTTELTKSFGWDTIDSFMQHDVQELNRVLQDNLETKMKGTKVEGAINNLFCGKIKSYIKCIDVDYESSKIEEFLDIQLNVKGMKDLYESFKSYVQVETLERENRYRADGFGLQVAKKGDIFMKFPPVLNLHMKRFELDMVHFTTVKINDRHEFPLSIDLEEFLAEEAERHCHQKYHLFGVLVHSGDIHGGHYCAFLRKTENDKIWLKFDDDKVTKVTEKEAVTDNFGGDYDQSVPVHELRGMNKYKKFTNAYMLVYIREADIHSVLTSCTKDDIPQYLVDRLEEEKQKDLAKKLEKQQQHLFTNVKVYTDEAIRGNLEYDLVNSETKNSAMVLKLKKDDTIETLKKQISLELGISLDSMRLWNLIRRKNRTIRPDFPALNIDTAMLRTLIYSQDNEILIYLEKPNETGHFPPSEDKGPFMLFVKFYDPIEASLKIVGSCFPRPFDLTVSVVPWINKTLGFPTDTRMKLFEEVKFGYILPIPLDKTFLSQEISHGDIICAQRDEPLGRDVPFPDVPKYLEMLENRIVVHFKPKDDSNHKDLRLTLSKKMTYDMVSKVIAQAINGDSRKIRFFVANYANGVPRTPIRKANSPDLCHMLQTASCNLSNDVLHYEITEIPVEQLEECVQVHVIFKAPAISKTVDEIFYLPKKMTVNQLQKEYFQDRIQWDTEYGSGSIRLLEVVEGRLSRVLLDNETPEFIDSMAEIYVEEIPSDELNLADDENLHTVFHFSKDPSFAHGIPFRMKIKKGDLFSKVKSDLQKKLKLPDKEFEKCGFAIISHGRCRFIPDNEIMNLSYYEQIAIDHPDKSVRNQSRFGAEKSIKIKS